MIIVIIGVLLLLALLWAVVTVVARCRLFHKTGCPWWAAIIPFYGNYLFHKITWGNGWFFLAEYIPAVGIGIYILTQAKLARCFDKSMWFAAGLVFLHPLFLMFLAFGSSRYLGVVDLELFEVMAEGPHNNI